MDAGIEFNQSAFKHGVTKENIRYAFAHVIVDFPVVGEEEKTCLSASIQPKRYAKLPQNGCEKYIA
jgi:hypothetical protein